MIDTVPAAVVMVDTLTVVADRSARSSLYYDLGFSTEFRRRMIMY